MGKSMKTAIASSSSSKPKSAASAKRASVACVSCKTRRTRCVKSEGQEVCVYCRRHSLECIMTEDERKRATSKVYLDSLRSRIVLLEEMLRRSGTEPPLMEPVADGKNANSRFAHQYQNSDGKQLGQPKSPTPQPQRQIHIRSHISRERSPLDLEGYALEDSAPSLVHEDGNSTDWSRVSAGFGSETVPSVPSLSSGDDESHETGWAAMHHVSTHLCELNESRMKKKEWQEDWGMGVESSSCEAWEGQAALLDMDFMLGLGSDEVFPVQKGTQRLAAVEKEEEDEYRFFEHDGEIVMEYKLA